MKVTIVTGGSRGDVQPYLALGLGLQRAGHTVRIAAYAPFEEFVRSRGLDFAPLSGHPRLMVEHTLEAGVDPFKFMKYLNSAVEPFAEQNLEEIMLACGDADAIVYTYVGFWGYMVAQSYGVPAVGAALQPLFHPTASFPSSIEPFGISPPSGLLKRWYNKATYIFPEHFFWLLFRRTIDDLRVRKLGLPRQGLESPIRRLRKDRMGVIFGWSPRILPQPQDWGPHLKVSGYWFLDTASNWKPSEELGSFLESGPPPVSIGFGSVVRDSLRDVIPSLCHAAIEAGERVLFLRGWSGVKDIDLPDGVFVVDEVPHEWLFPRVKAAVHHASAGTTAAALRAGIPHVPLPFNAEEAFWARRLHTAGVATPTLDSAKLPGEKEIADILIRASSDLKLRRRAGALGRAISAENGVETATEVFDQFVTKIQ